MRKVGEYILKKEIGKGSYAEVFLAHKETQQNEEFAIKRIEKLRLLSSMKLCDLFNNETTILKEIDHPNILKCYEVLETGSAYYMVLEYCDGGDLEKHLALHKKLPEEEILFISKQILNGFRELVARKIMHRDIKLANIFLSNDRVVIGDFGFAKEGVALTTTKLGSPMTMAPEIYLCDGLSDYDSKVDIWSLGLVFYQLAFGRQPWEVDNEAQLKEKIQTAAGQKLPFPVFSTVGKDWKQLLMRMIERDPLQRIGWEELFNHPIFDHQAKTLSFNQVSPQTIIILNPSPISNQETVDVSRTIPIRPSESEVNKLFEQNRLGLHQLELVAGTLNLSPPLFQVLNPLPKLEVNTLRSDKNINRIFRDLRVFLFQFKTHKSCFQVYFHMNSSTAPSLKLFAPLSCYLGKKAIKRCEEILKKAKTKLGDDHKVTQEVAKLYEKYREKFLSTLKSIEERGESDLADYKADFEECKEGTDIQLESLNLKIGDYIGLIMNKLESLIKVVGDFDRKIIGYLYRANLISEFDEAIKKEVNGDRQFNWYQFEQSLRNKFEIQIYCNELYRKYKSTRKPSK